MCLFDLWPSEKIMINVTLGWEDERVGLRQLLLKKKRKKKRWKIPSFFQGEHALQTLSISSLKPYTLYYFRGRSKLSAGLWSHWSSDVSCETEEEGKWLSTAAPQTVQRAWLCVSVPDWMRAPLILSEDTDLWFIIYTGCQWIKSFLSFVFSDAVISSVLCALRILQSHWDRPHRVVGWKQNQSLVIRQKCM